MGKIEFMHFYCDRQRQYKMSNRIYMRFHFNARAAQKHAHGSMLLEFYAILRTGFRVSAARVTFDLEIWAKYGGVGGDAKAEWGKSPGEMAECAEAERV